MESLKTLSLFRTKNSIPLMSPPKLVSRNNSVNIEEFIFINNKENFNFIQNNNERSLARSANFKKSYFFKKGENPNMKNPLYNTLKDFNTENPFEKTCGSKLYESHSVNNLKSFQKNEKFSRAFTYNPKPLSSEKIKCLEKQRQFSNKKKKFFNSRILSSNYLPSNRFSQLSNDLEEVKDPLNSQSHFVKKYVIKDMKSLPEQNIKKIILKNKVFVHLKDLIPKEQGLSESGTFFFKDESNSNKLENEKVKEYLPPEQKVKFGKTVSTVELLLQGLPTKRLLENVKKLEKEPSDLLAKIGEKSKNYISSKREKEKIKYKYDIKHQLEALNRVKKDIHKTLGIAKNEIHNQVDNENY